MTTRSHIATILALVLATASAVAADPAEPTAARPAYDAQLAKDVGADEHGMRAYVLVILKTGPKPMPAGEERTKMFQGHFANINRLADAGKLALAGPFDDKEHGWRGMFIFAVPTIDEARALTASDPVISSGEMIAEYHKYYGSAALMKVNAMHKTIASKSF